MSVITWPAYLPPALLEQYSSTPVDCALRTEMDTGNVRMRPRPGPPPETVQVSWIMNSGQAAYFEGWFFNKILGGSLPFDMEVSSNEGNIIRTCLFVSSYTATPLSDQMMQFTANLLLENDNALLWGSRQEDVLEWDDHEEDDHLIWAPA